MQDYSSLSRQKREIIAYLGLRLTWFGLFILVRLRKVLCNNHQRAQSNYNQPSPSPPLLSSLVTPVNYMLHSHAKESEIGTSESFQWVIWGEIRRVWFSPWVWSRRDSSVLCGHLFPWRGGMSSREPGVLVAEIPSDSLLLCHGELMSWIRNVTAFQKPSLCGLVVRWGKCKIFPAPEYEGRATQREKMKRKQGEPLTL